MTRKFLGYVLIHPTKEDFVVGSKNSDVMTLVAYGDRPEQAKVFKDFEEIKDFLFYADLGDFAFDVAKLFDAKNRYEVEYETSVSNKPIN